MKMESLPDRESAPQTADKLANSLTINRRIRSFHSGRFSVNIPIKIEALFSLAAVLWRLIS